MRIGFLGKGGSGKTSLAAAYARYCSSLGRKVLAIDVDVNAHLAEALGASKDPEFVGKRFEELACVLEGERKCYKKFGISNIPCFGSVPPCSDTRFIKIDSSDPFIKKYGVDAAGVPVLAVGPHEEKDFSSSCYHYMLNTIELVYHRLLDGKNDWVISDSAAGADSLGTSLYMVHDLQVFVVEPTQQSLSVYQDYKERVLPLDVNLRCVLNKVRNSQDEEFLRQRIQSEEIVAVFSKSEDLKAFERGDLEGASRFSREAESQFKAIDEALKSISRDWNAYFTHLKELYERECHRWWNPYYKADLTEIPWNSAEVMMKQGAFA